MKTLRLERLMRLRGVYVSKAIDAAAAQRCLQCPSKPLCDESLAAGDVRSLALFCPNTHYLQQLRGGSLSFT